MTRDTRAVYAIHGENDLEYPGWEIRTEELGHDPTHRGGTDYRHARHEPIARLNNGYGNRGTIPEPQHYEAFAQRAANFVAASEGCTRWIIGNEPNVLWERPNGRPIAPTDYARCYNLCRAAIKALPGHADDEVLIAAVGPWNNQTTYAGNEAGDWIVYFADVQRAVAGLDGIALHTYSQHGQTPEGVATNAKMRAPFTHRTYGFQTYREWMDAILPRYRGLPVYITETNAGGPWRDENTGFVQRAYQEIFTWNKAHPDRAIWCLALYRWQTDKWIIRDKSSVIADFREAVACGYTRPGLVEPQPEPPVVEPPGESEIEELAELIEVLNRRVDEQAAQIAELKTRIRAAGVALGG